MAAASASSKEAVKPTAAARKKTPRSGVQLMASAVFLLVVVFQCVLSRLCHLAAALLTSHPSTLYTRRHANPLFQLSRATPHARGLPRCTWRQLRATLRRRMCAWSWQPTYSRRGEATALVTDCGAGWAQAAVLRDRRAEG